MINMPQEALGAVPQPGVNPQARSAPSPAQQLSPDDLDYFRHDPEIIAAVTKFMGRPIDPAEIPEELLANIAGMVQKLGVDGAVAEFQRILPPETIQQLRGAARR